VAGWLAGTYCKPQGSTVQAALISSDSASQAHMPIFFLGGGVGYCYRATSTVYFMKNGAERKLWFSISRNRIYIKK
jgi:hypothetical protein